jgi:thiamine pyrophosphate-dependent acetolactate synthase large subunit-like protein
MCIASLNGGWTADPEGTKPGRYLGYTRYDIVTQGLGCHGKYLEQPEDIHPALERAQRKVNDGMVALANVKTDYRARATTVRFSRREA